MKKKFKDCFFWCWIGISTLSVTASIGLPILSRTFSNELNFSQDNRILTFGSKQSKQANGVSNSTDVLNFAYESEHQVYGVTGFKNPDQLPPNYTLIIPKTYDDGNNGEHQVATITEYAFGSDDSNQPKAGSEKITHVDFGDIVFVGKSAFSNCPNLETISFGENIGMLENSCFFECPKLKCLTIPKNKHNTIPLIGPWAFAGANGAIKSFPEKIIFLWDIRSIISEGSSNIDKDGLHIDGDHLRVDEHGLHIDEHGSHTKQDTIYVDTNFKFNDLSRVGKVYAFLNFNNILAKNIDDLLKDDPSEETSGFWGFLGAFLEAIGKAGALGLIQMIVAFEILNEMNTVGSDHEFLMYENDGIKKLIGLNTPAKDKTELIIPSEINSIDKYSFQDRSENLKYITFPKGINITHIDQNAFVGVPDTTKYRVDVNNSDSSTLKTLKHALNNEADQKLFAYKDDGDFVVQGSYNYGKFNELVNLTENGRNKNELFVPKRINKIESDAFKGCSPNLKSVTFERGINLTNIDQNAFDNLPADTVFRVSDKIAANDLHSKTNVDPERIYYSSNNNDFIFYKNLNNHLELEQLTDGGKKSTKLTIPGNVVSIKKNAFSEHSNELNSIVFEDGSKINNIADDVFENIPTNVLYYVNDEGLAQNLLERNDIQKQNVFSFQTNGSFVKTKKWFSHKTSVLCLTQNGQKELTLTIDNIDRIQANAFYGSSPNLERITFQDDNIGFDPNALKGVSDRTVYYVDSNNSECATINGLKRQGKFDVTKIYLQKANEQDFSVRNRLDHQDKALVDLNLNSLAKTELTIPSDINRIDSEAFKNITNPINKITFSRNIKLNHIGSNAFKNEKFKNTQYIFSSSDISVAKLLNQKGVNGDQIILKSDQYNISLSGILTEIKSGSNSEIKNLTSLVIPKKINGIDVTGVGSNAFNHCLNVTQIEFDNTTVLDKSKIDPNAFSKFNASKTLLYVYNSTSASALSEASTLTVGIANGDFFNEYHNQSKTIGLTSNGRSKTKLEVPSNIIDLKQYAFLGCSSKLNEIYIDGNNINLDDDTLNSIPQTLLEKVQFYVANDYVKNRLVKKHIPAKNVHLFASKTKNSQTVIGIAVGSILLAILLLGLGIGIPMRKQHKINLLQAKLNGKRINKLSAANAMAFKKVVETTGSINQQVSKLTSKMNLLNDAVIKVVKISDYSKPLKQSTKLPPNPKTNSTKSTTEQRLKR